MTYLTLVADGTEKVGSGGRGRRGGVQQLVGFLEGVGHVLHVEWHLDVVRVETASLRALCLRRDG